MKLILCDDRKCILDTDSHALITGGPGSGKTTIALLKAKKRIEEGLFIGQSVLFLSFSRAAVARVIETSKEHLSKNTLTYLSIQTFHSFFWEILRAYGYLLGAPKNLKLLLPHDESALRHGIVNENEEWISERERLFSEEGLVAFDLFAPKVLKLLSKSNRLRTLMASRHPMIVVDEAQDTAEEQWHIVKLFAEKVQLICLADLDQQIFDFRPGVSSERLTQIMQVLNPLRIDLQGQNHRSQDSEIVIFGNDILLNTPRGTAYKGVSRKSFRSAQKNRDSAIRSSVGMIASKVRETVGSPPENIAILTTRNRGVTVIGRALTGNGPSDLIPHRVMIDKAPILLSSRLIAFLMEPKVEDELLELAEALDLTASVYRSKGSKSNLDQAKRLTDSALLSRQGKAPRRTSVAEQMLSVLRGLKEYSFCGIPKKDWLEARRRLRESGSKPLSDVALSAEQLFTFQRGQRIDAELIDLWQTQGNYSGARKALDLALSEDYLFSGGNDLHGIHVMTIHKSKGKEFDAVIILDESNISPLILSGESQPYPRSRKLLRVGITRAKYHVLLLTDLFNPSDLLRGHQL